MRIRTTTGPSASPPPGLNKDSKDQQNYPPRRIDADSPGVSATDKHADQHPRSPPPSPPMTKATLPGGSWPGPTPS